MKKIILTLFICGVMFFGITGCGRRKNEFSVGEKSNLKISQEDVSLMIKNGTLKKTSATLILKNNSSKNFSYGNPYEIEIMKDGEWHKIDVQLNFTLPSFELKAGESKEIEMNWENGYGKLAQGMYRIIKDIDYEYEEGKYENFNVAVEFTIE